MEGLVEEGKEVLEEDGEPSLIDAALIGAAQRVEHYEMAAYGTTRAMAETLGHKSVVKLLQQTLGEERSADEKLTMIAETEVLRDAAAVAEETAAAK
jgi:ferritin-like metal-binding protein YciE